jgi:hypothetical protein
MTGGCVVVVGGCVVVVGGCVVVTTVVVVVVSCVVVVGGFRYVYVLLPPVVLVMPSAMTTTETAPGACAGAVARTVVEFRTVTPVAATPPKVTDVVPLRSVPLIVTTVLPDIGPSDGERLEIAGGLR